jgi:uncharacterized membrane protein YfcA
MLGSIPFAVLGGRLSVESSVQNWILAATLLYASAALVIQVSPQSEVQTRPSRPLAIASGAGIGLLSGVVGVGGGIFLSPLLILLNWARPHTVASVSSVFILVNSLAGLSARPASLLAESVSLWPMMATGTLGAVAGSWLGANRVSSLGLRRALALILLVAVCKLSTK